MQIEMSLCLNSIHLTWLLLPSLSLDPLEKQNGYFVCICLKVSQFLCCLGIAMGVFCLLFFSPKPQVHTFYHSIVLTSTYRLALKHPSTEYGCFQGKPWFCALSASFRETADHDGSSYRRTEPPLASPSSRLQNHCCVSHGGGSGLNCC